MKKLYIPVALRRAAEVAIKEIMKDENKRKVIKGK